MALAFGISCMPASAVEFSVEGLIAASSSGTVLDYLAAFAIDQISANPVIAVPLLALSSALPLISLIANRTKNPLDNALLIFINKVLQTLTFNSSTNQPDVLSWTQMLTNHPRDWPALLVIKASDETIYIRERIFK